MPLDLPPFGFAALDAARHPPATPRLPLWLGRCEVGSVAPEVLAALRSAGPWLALEHGALVSSLSGQALDAALAQTHDALRAQGLITGWRDEILPVVDPRLRPIDALFARPPLAGIERAAARLWGTLTFGAHANGYVADAQGRPQALWIAERSAAKPTDPGKLDNLVGGGVPLGQTPRQALLREAWEEAGLAPATAARAEPGRVIELRRALPDCAGFGWQWEWLFCFDLPLDAATLPSNQDGEVAALRLVPIDEALALAAGDAMTVDAALVTLDFGLRHRLLAPEAHAALAGRFETLLVPVAPSPVF